MTEALALFNALKVPDRRRLPDDGDALQKSHHCVGGEKGIWWFWTSLRLFHFYCAARDCRRQAFSCFLAISCRNCSTVPMPFWAHF